MQDNESSDLTRDHKQGMLAECANSDKDSMKELRISLEPLTNHIVDFYISEYQESNENNDKVNKEKVDVLRSTLMDAAWSVLPKAIDSFNTQNKDDKFRLGTFFSFLARNAVKKELDKYINLM